MLSELLYADDIVLKSETIKRLGDMMILTWKEAFESKCLKVNLGKTKVIVSGGITKDGMPKSKVDLSGVSSMKAKANCDYCVQCGKWMHNRCAKIYLNVLHQQN